MKKRKKKRKLVTDVFNAVKANQRSDEISEHGKPVSCFHIAKSKKVYTRKRKHKKRIED